LGDRNVLCLEEQDSGLESIDHAMGIEK
jgi:hypothetical protein